MRRRLTMVSVAGLALAVAAAPASAKEVLSTTLSADDAVDRSCTTRQLSSGEGYAHRTVTMPASGWLTARLDAGDGDWDVAVFDASGDVVAGSAGAGGREAAAGLVTGGSELVVQACRRSGAEREAELSVEALPVDTSKVVKPKLVRISVPNRARLRELQSLGLDLTEHGSPGVREAVIYGAEDARKLRDARFVYTVEVADLAAQAAQDRRADLAYAASVRSSPLPSGRDTYRRLFDYDEELKALAGEVPDEQESPDDLVKLITLSHPSYEGRTVSGIEITKDVHARDGKPVFLQMGLHHAREWPSGEHSIEWAYELLKGYREGDPRVRALLESTRTIVVPVVNPDGFNQSREAGELYLRGAGGDDDVNDNGTSTDTEFILAAATHPNEYKRKNCRFLHDDDDEGSGSCHQPDTGIVGPGVDPNRNYGGFWGGPGASSNPLDQTYRGTGPFSEPETQNIRELVSTRQVTTLITNHTYTNLVLRPPGIQQAGETPDEPIYRELGDAMASKNGYTSQFGYQLYDTTGTTEDWSYYSTGGLGYTFEIGDLGFHPPYEETIAEYVGTTDDAQKCRETQERCGNREAYFLAHENAADAQKHSVISGSAPADAVLRVRKEFETPTSQKNEDGSPRTFSDTLETVMDVPPSGQFEWHVNPSTRPLVVNGHSRPATGDPSPPGSFAGSAGLEDNHPCADFDTEDPACFDDHAFTVPEGEGVDNAKATVRIEWTTPASDWDLKVYRDSNGDGSSEGEGQPVGTSGMWVHNSDGRHEQTTFTVEPGAQYVARVINYAAADPYEGTITYAGPDPYVPPEVESWTLTCESPQGEVKATEQVTVKRGERVSVDLFRACGGRGKRPGKGKPKQ